VVCDQAEVLESDVAVDHAPARITASSLPQWVRFSGPRMRSKCGENEAVARKLPVGPADIIASRAVGNVILERSRARITRRSNRARFAQRRVMTRDGHDHCAVVRPEDHGFHDGLHVMMRSRSSSVM